MFSQEILDLQGGHADPVEGGREENCRESVGDNPEDFARGRGGQVDDCPVPVEETLAGQTTHIPEPETFGRSQYRSRLVCRVRRNLVPMDRLLQH